MGVIESYKTKDMIKEELSEQDTIEKEQTGRKIKKTRDIEQEPEKDI